MATITEDYCSKEIYRLLIEKGFDGEVHTTFDEEGYTQTSITLQMAMKWLRKVHHWHIFVIPRWEDVENMPGEWEETMVGYQYVIINVGEVNKKNEQPTTTALSPESAYEEAIKYCLTNLI